MGIKASLTLAKLIADDPRGHSLDHIHGAWEYLTKLRRNGGVRNSERASEKLERRIASLEAEIALRTTGSAA